MPHADLSKRRIYYELHGEAAASDTPPLVLVMGMAGSCSGWLPLQVPHFAESRRVLIFDNRGVAKSEDDGAPFEIADLARDTVELLDALEIEKVDLLGPFMGGMTAQEFAIRYPERLDRLVLIGTYAKPDAKRKMLLQHWGDLVRQGLPAESLVRERLLWTLNDETLEQSDLIQAMTEFFVRDDAPVSPSLFERQAAACARHDTLERLNEIQHPTLILCGQQDQLTPTGLHREMAERISDSRFVTLPYGGHLIMVESAERFNEITSQFLDDER